MALIQSQRHTVRDLEHWRSFERVDRVTGRRLARGPKPQRAIEQIQRFASEGSCYLSTSWGKDSVVAAHLFVLAGVDAPMVHIVQEGPHKDPDQSLVRDAFLERFPHVDYHEIVVEPQTREQDADKKTPALQVGIKRASKQFSPRWIGGLRAAESGVRKRAASKRTKGSCWPIARWSAAEVYGWLAYNDLPVHPAYACTQGGMWDRDWIRVSIIGGQKGRTHGRRAWEWAYYPEVMERLLNLGLVGPPSIP